MLGTTISVWQAVRATSERNDKEIARREAVEARNDADAARREVEGFAERLKEANILVTGGRAHADAERWAAAYADFTAATERQPNYYNAWIERASLEVRLGLWKLAARDYSKALELGVPVDSPANWGIPQLFLWNDDQDSYRQYCKGMLDAAEKNGQTVSIAVIRSCVMAQDPVTDGETLSRLAEELLADYRAPFPLQDGPMGLPFLPNMNVETPPSGPPNFEPPLQPNARERSGNSGSEREMRGLPPHDAPPDRPPPAFGWPPWGRIPYPRGVMDYVAGLAAYRAGQLELAVIRLEQALDDKGWRSREVAYAALSMAYHRSGKAKESRAAFESSVSITNRWTNEILQSPVGRMPLPWFEWIEVKLLHREASMLLTGFAPVEDPRLREIEKRAVDAIAGNTRE